VGIIIRRRR